MLPYIDLLFRPLFQMTGISIDIIKLLTTLYLSFPLSGLLKRFPDDKPGLKNVFIIGYILLLYVSNNLPASVSLFYMVGLFDLWAGLVTLLISSLLTYLTAAFVKARYMPWIVFVLVMGHMSIT
jgi:lysophospholipid acyltransferase